DLDPASHAYKSGDGFLAAAKRRSNQDVVILDSTGRSYRRQSHTLPSARGRGGPPTGRLPPPSGARLIRLLLAADRTPVLMATDAGYGFVARLGDVQSRNRAGKAAITIPAGGRVLPPQVIDSLDGALVVAVSNEGRMLVFPLGELPELSKGK